MKELPIEEKAKAYDEALERAKKYLGDCVLTRQEYIEKVFPELARSEDEKMKEEIIQFLRLPHPQFVGKRNHEEWIAWIEKQGEQKPLFPDNEVRDIWEYIAKFKTNYGHYPSDADEIEVIVREVINKRTQPTDSVEPKFSIDDWAVTDKNSVVQIKAIEDSKYVLENTMRFSVDYVDKCWRKWTIQDAKDGDVLSYVTDTGDLWIMFYWSWYEPYEGHVHYHAIRFNDNFNGEGTCCICIDNLKPATKEQRDLLFKKMEEAGYEWDADKKELKKIEQKSTKSIVNSSIKPDPNPYWTLAPEYQLMNYQKHTWSEEDENMLTAIICSLDSAKLKRVWGKQEEDVKNWIQSFMPQNRWKPDPSMLTCLEYAIKHIDKDGDKRILSKLLEQLKKL